MKLFWKYNKSIKICTQKRKEKGKKTVARHQSLEIIAMDKILRLTIDFYNQIIERGTYSLALTLYQMT